MAVSFVWFDMGYTLLYMQRETTYQQALRNFGIEIPLDGIENCLQTIGRSVKNSI